MENSLALERKIGVGIIGAGKTGWASRAHIPALKLLPEFDLVAVSTTKMSSAEVAAVQFGAIHAFDNETDLVNCPEVELVVITVKVPHHHKLVKAAIEAGKLIYCEWPLGNGTKEAQELAELAAAKGVKTFTGLQALSLPETLYLKKVIAGGLIGEVLSSSLIGSGRGWSFVKAEDALYMVDPANGSTMLTIPFGHTIAAYLDVLGDYKSINATLARRRQEVPLLTTGEMVPQLTEDQIVVSGILKNGTVSSIHYRSGSSAGTNFLWEINGTQGDIVITADFGHFQLAAVEIKFSKSGEKLQPLEIPPEYLHNSLTAPEQPVRGVYFAYKAVWNDIINNTQLVPDFNYGVRIHKLLDTINRSAAEHKAIIL